MTYITTWIEILTRLGCLLKVKRTYLDIHVTGTPLLRFQNTTLLKSSHYAMIEAILRYINQLFYYKHKYIVNGNWKQKGLGMKTTQSLRAKTGRILQIFLNLSELKNFKNESIFSVKKTQLHLCWSREYLR